MIKPIKQTVKILVNHIDVNNQPEGFISKTVKNIISKANRYEDLYTSFFNWWQFFGDDSPDMYDVMNQFIAFNIMSREDANRIDKVIAGISTKSALKHMDKLYELQTHLGGDDGMLDILDI